MATLLSDAIAEGIATEGNVSLGDIEQGMRQILQDVGRRAIGQALEKLTLWSQLCAVPVTSSNLL